MENKIINFIEKTTVLSEKYKRINSIPIEQYNQDQTIEDIKQILLETENESKVISNMLDDIFFDQLDNQEKQDLIQCLNKLFSEQAETAQKHQKITKGYVKINKINELREKMINTDTKPPKS